MNHLDIAKKEGGDKLYQYWTTNDCYYENLAHMFGSHERAIEIALLEDLVEEAKVMKVKETHSENYESYVAFNSALTTLITKYQDRIKKLKS